jgi:choice-of-anchor C domain-containing protein
MGRVYLAATPAGRPVALKVVRSEISDDPEFRTRFHQEILAAQRVHGLYTAQLLDADPAATPPWLATAYVPGPSLRQAITDNGPMPEATVFRLVAGVAEALQAIHAAGIVHRDLKPSNVLLAQDGPRVIDFGIARALESTALTRSGMLIGSPQFMAPEQILDKPVTPAIDVFALGALAAYAVLGRSPFGDGHPAAICYRMLHEPPDLQDCPPQLRTLIEPCLAKEAAARPALDQIIKFCLAQTGGAADPNQSWLPPALAAAVTSHAPPRAMDTGRRAVPDDDRRVATVTATAPVSLRAHADHAPRADKRRFRFILFTGAAVAAAALIAGIVTAAWPSAPPVNLILNAGFENQKPPCTDADNNGICEYDQGSTAIPYWTVGGNSVDITTDNSFQSATGNTSVDLSGSASGSLTQKVATTAGSAYILKWRMAGNTACGQKTKTMEVYWNGVRLGTFGFNTSNHTTKSMGWVTRQITVTAGAQESSVEFADATPGNAVAAGLNSACGATLDDVSLVPA